ncbi:MAG: 3-hydroxybutyrate dehydrogenase [Holosporales bacterium]|jgi:3-hydroxybutyrate dehydrogenase|nr:3-hydroxybutyrate dehydrogenase [Holosporales bacterium]
MAGKVVIVTGSTSGIGLGIAETFAKNKDLLVLNGIEKENDVADLMKKIQNLSGHAPLYSNADLSQAEGCKELIAKSLKEFKRVDVLVNNAGIQHVEEVTTFPQERWEKIIQLNLSACFFLSQGVLPSMYQNKWGRLIHISSAHGLVASAKKSAYVAAKHGVLGLSKVMALEAAGTGVTSNCICPGWVLTPLVERQIQDNARASKISFQEAQKELLLKKQPSGEFATPEEMGALALFLASDAAAQITGTAIPVDGGWTAQ